ncbi:MAG: hypothetical protein PHY09_07465 [Desulfuromonadaceae bacterium]|nr:hypothetical protein [Desulfuromonadaceae bacterium]MDD5106761.1 hypothetical protein [Desulfuromonadaceae bacterium]
MLTNYLQTFSTLRSGTSRSRWTAATKYRAPHKPLFLLGCVGEYTFKNWPDSAGRVIWCLKEEYRYDSKRNYQTVHL